MFELTNHDAKVSSFNPRAEKHGEENEMAGDLKFQVDCPASVLDVFAPGLRRMLYRKPAVGEQQELIDGEAETMLGLPELEPLKWREEFPGYGLQIGYGMDLEAPLLFEDVTVRKFVFEPKNGGTVAVSFSCILHPDKAEAGQLCALIQEDVRVTLVSPKSKRDEDLVEQAEKPRDALEQAAEHMEAAA